MKFNLRDILWLTLAVGFGCAFWLEHRRALVWESRAVVLRQLVDAFEDPNYVEWTPSGVKLVYPQKKPPGTKP